MTTVQEVKARAAARDQFFARYPDVNAYFVALDRAIKLESGYMFGAYDFEHFQIARLYLNLSAPVDAAAELVNPLMS